MAFAERFETGARAYLTDGESVEIAVRASVPPTLTVMSVIMFLGLFSAFSLSAGVDSLRIRLIAVAAGIAVIATFFTVYANSFFRGPVGPYLVAGVTQDRILVFSRDMLGRLKGEPLVASRLAVGATLRKRALVMPHRITLTGITPEPLQLDVPRIEPSPRFVAAFDG
jgi:hypothetical protein